MTDDEQARKELVPGNDPYRLPSEPGPMVVTPEMASSWLSYRGGHPRLRRLNKVTAGRYQRLMEAGRWRQATPEGYIFDEEGYIISAQHRLKAQANGNITLTMWIFPNQPREIAPYLEAGRRRSTSDMLLVKYGTQIGAAARHLAALADGDRLGMPRYNDIMVSESVETYRQWPELDWHAGELYAAWRSSGVPMGPHAAVLAQASRTEHRDRIPAWLEGITTGYDLRPGDPRAHLRTRFHRGLQTVGRVNRRDMTYALIVKAWNAYATGSTLTELRYAVTELFPVVVGFDISKKGEAA